MESDVNSLYHLQCKLPSAFIKLIQTMDDSGSWRVLVAELQKYRIPVFLNGTYLERMEHSSSPSTFLLNELIARTCSIEDFKNILKQANLLNILALLCEGEPLEIVKQPGEENETIPFVIGSDLKLECLATGLPPPTYQWYFYNTILVGCRESTLVLPDFREENEGEYYCTVSQCLDDVITEISSNTVVCSLLDVAPVFVAFPSSVIRTAVGTELKLEVEVSCNSSYKLQWIKFNKVLTGETNNTLVMKHARISDSGLYRCVARNSAGEVFSEPLAVDVYPDGEKRNKKVPAKFALLIANERYDHYANLPAPAEDIVILSNKLTALNFRVIAVVNLTLKEMLNVIDWFFHIVPSRAYVFFCYVGHGFSMGNNKFMMPVDCPEDNNYKMADCIYDEFVVKKAKEKKLQLLVKVLDMCLKMPSREYNTEIYKEGVPDCAYEPYPKCNVVHAFATSSHQAAYEHRATSRGLYISHLCKYLDENKTVVQIFQKAHEDFSQFNVADLQQPSLSFDADHRFKLNDPVAENEKAKAEMDKVTKLMVYNQLIFSKIGVSTTLLAMPHKGRILNVIDLYFSHKLLNEWHISIEVYPENVESCWSKSEEGESEEGDDLLTLYNLQKAKSDVFLHVKVSEKEGEQKIRDYAQVDLGFPLIAAANLWF